MSTKYIVNNAQGQTIPEINSTTIISDTISASTYSNLPIPSYISSGPTAPGSAVVANNTDVDINFSDGIGTAWSFSTTGMTFPDDTVQTTAYEPKYKVYTALLTQTDEDAPIAIVLENTLGATLSYSRTNIGQYVITTTGTFPQDKTWAVINTPSYDGNGPFALQIGRISDTECHIYSYQTFPSSTALEDLGTGADRVSIEIRVYN
jgi:hypothetical protein